MKLYKEFEQARLRAQQAADDQIKDREAKAFEYGTLTVKNAFLVSGAALVAVPAIVGLSFSVEIETSKAAVAGGLFAVSLIVALLATYVAHVNWTLHVVYWEERRRTEYDYLKQLYDDDETMRREASFEKPQWTRWIQVTFWLPHVLVPVFLGCVTAGWYYLYSAFSIF